MQHQQSVNAFAFGKFSKWKTTYNGARAVAVCSVQANQLPLVLPGLCLMPLAVHLYSCPCVLLFLLPHTWQGAAAVPSHPQKAETDLAPRVVQLI